MITIIKGATVYSPEFQGVKDVVLMAGKIASLEDRANLSWENGDVQTIDGSDYILTPGFVDPHVHILGGGGEGGCHTRAPEVLLSECIKAGSTTVVGLLGTDGYTRDMVGLLGKAKGLEEEGISTYLFSGCYHIPSVTLTGDVIHDLIAVDKILGPGEVAISDHRSSQPSFDEIKRLVADARVGGMLSGKAGITHFHLGDGDSKLDPLFRILDETEIPITQMYPTHVSRNPELFQEAIRYAKLGGPIDMTPTSNPELWERLYGEVRVSKCYKACLEAGVSSDLVTFSSDGHGSQPIFDENMNYVGMEVAALNTPFLEVVSCVRDLDIPLETALKPITSNPARILKLKGKGKIEAGYDADLCMIHKETLELASVIAGGKFMMKDKELLVKGTFE